MWTVNSVLLSNAVPGASGERKKDFSSIKLVVIFVARFMEHPAFRNEKFRAFQVKWGFVGGVLRQRQTSLMLLQLFLAPEINKTRRKFYLFRQPVPTNSITTRCNLTHIAKRDRRVAWKKLAVNTEN